VELLEDERIPEASRVALAQWSEGDPCIDPSAALPASFCASVKSLPPRPALLRIVASSGEELSRLALERSVAELEFIRFPRIHDSLLTVRVDLTADMGSYNGPMTRLPGFDGGHLRWMRATGSPPDTSDEIDLGTMLKVGWQADSLAERPTLLMVECHPDYDKPASRSGDLAFLITYTRYFRDAGGWHQLERQEPGFWENEEWPPRSSFP